MNLKDKLKLNVQTWFDLGSHLSTQVKIDELLLQVAFCKKQKVFFINVDQFLLNQNDFEKKVNLPDEVKIHAIFLSEINARQRFIPLSAISKTYCRTQINGAIKLDSDFLAIKHRVILITEYFSDMPIMDIKQAPKQNKNTFNFKKFKIEYLRADDGLFFRFVDISKALGYRSVPYDTFADVLSYQFFGGEEVRAISFKNIFNILDKIKGDKKEIVRELISKITYNFFHQKKVGLMVDNKNEIIIVGTSAIPYKREFGSILFQTRNLMYHLGLKGDGGLKGKSKELSEFFEEDSCYYIDIKMLPELKDSFVNKTYKANLSEFIKLTNKFKR